MKMLNIVLVYSLLMLVLLPISSAAGEAPSRSEVKAMISKAENSLQGARNVGHEWTTTGKLIKSAKKALQDNDLAKAYKLAVRADGEGKASMQQKVAAEKYWTLYLPR